MSTSLFDQWLEPSPATEGGVRLYRERSGARARGLRALKHLLANHFVGEATVLRAGGYAKAADVIANSLPTNKRTQSGDLAELIGTEYVNAATNFRAPIQKLRWKSDREMPLHGNDIVAVDTSGTPAKILKGECKSRVSFSDAVAREAVQTLDAHDGRPNPSTLAFITKRLFEENRDTEARVYQKLQAEGAMSARTITHGIFVLAGNDPSNALGQAPKSRHKGVSRQSVGVVIPDHGAFVTAVFQLHGR